ncbi:MAG: hypothetical protein ABR533_03720 [Desulfonatronovibrio sp.]
MDNSFMNRGCGVVVKVKGLHGINPLELFAMVVMGFAAALGRLTWSC